jgi:hypothetical protein
LTLKDLRELAEFEYLTMSNPTQLGGHIGREIDFSPGSFPRDLYAGSVLAESILFFVVVSFAAFSSEAATNETFPAAATLFGAFSKSTWQLCVFYLALWTPVVACCAIAFTSAKVIIGVGIIPVLLCTLSAQRALERRSFFKRFKPLTVLENKGRKLLKR